MRRTKCIECNKEISVNDSFIYKEAVYCEDCLNKKIKNGTKILTNELIRQLDSTVFPYLH